MCLSQEIMEKWSRPIFSKLMDERSGKTFLSTNDVSLAKTIVTFRLLNSFDLSRCSPTLAAQSMADERLQKEIKSALLLKVG